MKGKKDHFLRVVKKGTSKEQCNTDINKRLRDVQKEMKQIIDMIDSNIKRDNNIPPLAK